MATAPRRPRTYYFWQRYKEDCEVRRKHLRDDIATGRITITGGRLGPRLSLALKQGTAVIADRDGPLDEEAIDNLTRLLDGKDAKPGGTHAYRGRL